MAARVIVSTWGRLTISGIALMQSRPWTAKAHSMQTTVVEKNDVIALSVG